MEQLNREEDLKKWEKDWEERANKMILELMSMPGIRSERTVMSGKYLNLRLLLVQAENLTGGINSDNPDQLIQLGILKSLSLIADEMRISRRLKEDEGTAEEMRQLKEGLLVFAQACLAEKDQESDWRTWVKGIPRFHYEKAARLAGVEDWIPDDWKQIIYQEKSEGIQRENVYQDIFKNLRENYDGESEN